MVFPDAPADPTEALARIGHDEELRERFVLACLAAEERLSFTVQEADVGSVRDLITGPIIDALFADVGTLRRELSTGEVFEFTYRSKIAREFLLSMPRVPDHVWEPQTTKAVVRLASHAREVVIGGAYFGDQAILVARALVPGGRVHAFEPNPEQAALLRRNAELNDVSSIEVHVMALWGTDGIGLHQVGDDAHASFEAVSDDPAGTIEASMATTIDAHAARFGIDQIDLIMLDIEGGEYEALSGGQVHLGQPADRAPVVVFEVHRSYVDWDAGLASVPVVGLLAEAGYTLFAIRDFQGNVDMAGAPIELVPIDDVYLEGPPHGFNVLAVKDLTRLDRLGDWVSCPGVSPKLLLHKDPALHLPLSSERA